MYAYLAFIGILLIIGGFVALFAYTFLNMSPKNSTTSAGGLIMIGPIPIVFGTSASAVMTVEILAIIMIILMILFFFLFSRR